MNSTDNIILTGQREVRQRTGSRHQFITRIRVFLSMLLRRGSSSSSNDSEKLDTASRVFLNPSLADAAKRMSVGLVKDVGRNPYYTKYKRFLETNNIPFGFVNIHSSAWLRDVSQYDVVVWHPRSSSWELDEAREKTLVMETYLGKIVYPSLKEIMFFENKMVQFHIMKALGLPVVDTFVSHDYQETLQWIERTEYPFVSKIRTSAGGSDIRLIPTRTQARILAETVFRIGRSTTAGMVRQKDYVYFQRFMPNHGYDLRISVVDEENIFGYFRLVPGGDFRASGFGDIVKTGLPEDAMRLALDAMKRLGLTNVSIDLLRSSSDDQYHIIEASTFIQIRTDMQTVVNDIPGRYSYQAEHDTFTFSEGRYWLQELALRKFIQQAVQRSTRGTLVGNCTRS